MRWLLEAAWIDYARGNYERSLRRFQEVDRYRPADRNYFWAADFPYWEGAYMAATEMGDHAAAIAVLQEALAWSISQEALIGTPEAVDGPVAYSGDHVPATGEADQDELLVWLHDLVAVSDAYRIMLASEQLEAGLVVDAQETLRPVQGRREDGWRQESHIINSFLSQIELQLADATGDPDLRDRSLRRLADFWLLDVSEETGLWPLRIVPDSLKLVERLDEEGRCTDVQAWYSRRRADLDAAREAIPDFDPWELDAFVNARSACALTHAVSASAADTDACQDYRSRHSALLANADFPNRAWMSPDPGTWPGPYACLAGEAL